MSPSPTGAMSSDRPSGLLRASLLVGLALSAGGARAATEGGPNVGTALVVAIHEIQGARPSSSLTGRTVTSSGIVTAVTPQGFFLQAPDDEADDDQATSEGVFVATGSVPPAAVVAVGNALRVT